MRIDPPSSAEREAVRAALLSAADELGLSPDRPLARALFVARAGTTLRELVDELIRSDRDRHGLTYAEIGAAFGISMQSAHERFRPRRR
jgi:hypothetical protein